jgi:hypothetical protein
MGRGVAAGHFIGLVLLALPAGRAPASAQPRAFEACRNPALHRVAEALGARDGATIRLKDGNEVRLAGVIAPDREGNGEAAKRATAALDALVTGRRLSLHAGKNDRDR